MGWPKTDATAPTGATQEIDAVDLNYVLGGVFSVLAYSGVDKTGATDSYAGITAAMTAVSAENGGNGGTLYFPPGSYHTSQMLAWPYNVSIVMSPNASVTATAAMTAVFQSPLSSNRMNDQVFRGGAIYCNALAGVGIDLQWAQSVHIEDVCVEDFLVAGYRLGQTVGAGAGGNSYENRVTNCRSHRRVATVVANSIGLHLRGSTDNLISDCVFIGGETGAQVDSTASASMFSNVHCWVNLGRMKYGFNDLSTSTGYVNCYPDTPSIYGWWLQGNDTQIIAGRHYNNNAVGDDNVAIGVRVETSGASHSIANTHFWGQDNTHRIAADFSFNGSSANVNILSTIATNVVTTTGPQVAALFKGQSTASFRGATLYNSAGSNRDLIFQTSSGGAGLGSRAIIRCDSNAEGGASAGSNLHFYVVADDGTTLTELIRFTRSNGSLGFFNSGGSAKPTVSGSKGANAALTSLLSALSGLGLLTDSTT